MIMRYAFKSAIKFYVQHPKLASLKAFVYAAACRTIGSRKARELSRLTSRVRGIMARHKTNKHPFFRVRAANGELESGGKAKAQKRAEFII